MLAAQQIVSSFLLNFISKEVCYPSYGCYSNAPPYNIRFALLPQPPHKLNTTYLLFSRKTVSRPQIFTAPFAKALNSLDMKVKYKTVIIAHGFIEDRNAYWVKPMISELLESQDMNVIFVDWGNAAKLPYSQSFGNSRVIATEIAMLIKELHERKLAAVESIHLIGFSTGAHIMGRVGYLLKRENLTLKRITGLDPAGPYFKNVDASIRLDADHAAFVDAIHSDAETPFLGSKSQEGHADFYPNGAALQPGCKRVTLDVFSKAKMTKYMCCSHFRSIDYFIESINADNERFNSFQCSSYELFTSGKCMNCFTSNTQNTCNRMGYHALRNSRGKFYLMTRNKKPFSGHHYAVFFYTGKSSSPLYGSVTFTVYGEKGRSNNITLLSDYYDDENQLSRVFVAPKSLGIVLKIDLTVKLWYEENTFLHKVEVIELGKNKYTFCPRKLITGEQMKITLEKKSCK